MSSPTGVPVFIISLERYPARRAPLCAQMDALSIPFEIIEGVDGWNLTDREIAARYDAQRGMRERGRLMTRGEIGCAHSHQKVLRMIVERNLDLAVVFEDDAIVGPEFKAVWQELGRLPRGIDYVSLYSYNGVVERKAEMQLGDVALHRAPTQLWGSVAYVVTRECAQRLIEPNGRVAVNSDWRTTRRWRRQYLALPLPVGHRDGVSTLDGERKALNHAQYPSWLRKSRWLRILLCVTFVTYFLRPFRYAGLADYFRREVQDRFYSTFTLPHLMQIDQWHPKKSRPAP